MAWAAAVRVVELKAMAGSLTEAIAVAMEAAMVVADEGMETARPRFRCPPRMPTSDAHLGCPPPRPTSEAHLRGPPPSRHLGAVLETVVQTAALAEAVTSVR